MLLRNSLLALLASLLIALCYPPAAWAQQQPQPKQQPPQPKQPAKPQPSAQPAPEDDGVLIRMAVIDVQAILRDATAVKDIRSQLEKYRLAFQSEIEKEEQEIVNANQELGRQRTILSPEAYTEERRKFENRVVDAQRLVQQRKQELNDVLNEAMGEVQNVLNDVITEIARAHQFSLLFRKDQTILVIPQLEITHLVLNELNKRLPAIKVKAPGPRAAQQGQPKK